MAKGGFRTKKIPDSLLRKLPLAEDALILEHKVQEQWITYHDPERQSRYRYLEGFPADQSFALDEPA